MNRCPWSEHSELERVYHDEEWGVPVHDDRLLFEFLILEGAQAGLSWLTVLKKREHYRKVFDGFDAERIARYTPRKVARLLEDPGIIRNRLKVESTVTNARAMLDARDTHGSFDQFIWSFVGGEAVINQWEKMEQVPAFTPQSDHMSKSLKKAGFRFVGSTICYAFMQAVGMVNDHLVSCPRHSAVQVDV